MAVDTDTATLDVATREDRGSRAARRLRRTGRVPGVIYGGEGGPIAFDVDARTLRQTLAHSGAVIELCVDGGSSEPVLLKHAARHPVRGEIIHADFLRIDLKKTIQTTVHIELTGAELAPGVDEGGVLNQELREVNVEALPGDLPDSIVVDVSKMLMNETLTLSSVIAPAGVKLLDDPEQTVIATITPPTLEPVEEEIETETEVVGEGEEAPDGQAEGGDAAGDGGDAESSGGGDSE